MSDQGFLPGPGPTPVAAFPADAELPVDVVVYGPDIPDESGLRLLGPIEGKRVLVLGAGRGHTAVALASQGAHVIVVDAHHDRLEAARGLADAHEVKLELHHGDLAELAFVRADTVDAALSVHELGRLDDLDRVLRQVNRVLRTGSALVCSLPHPASLMLDDTEPGPPRVVRPYADRSPRVVDDDPSPSPHHRRGVLRLRAGQLPRRHRARARRAARRAEPVLDRDHDAGARHPRRAGPQGRRLARQPRLALGPPGVEPAVGLLLAEGPLLQAQLEQEVEGLADVAARA